MKTQIKIKSGLTSSEVLELQKKHGYNELPTGHKKPWYILVAEEMLEPMVFLLLACAAVYLVLGDPGEALLFIIAIAGMMIIEVTQKFRSSQAIDKLRDLSSPRALVIRDGQQIRIPGKDVTVGDIVLLKEGDRVPADGVLRDSRSLMIDESQLTGESLPIVKIANEHLDSLSTPMELPAKHCAYSGSLVQRGHGVLEVYGIGPHAYLGKIGKDLVSVKRRPSPLQSGVGKLVRFLGVTALLLCILIIGFSYFKGASILASILNGLTLGMAIIPEEIPVVLAVFLAMGALRISQKNVLTRNLSSIETLGSISVLCSDKTGTMTTNKMQVAFLVADDGSTLDLRHQNLKELPESVHQVAEFGILACGPLATDPMDSSLIALGDSALQNTEHLHKNWMHVRDYPLSNDFFAVSHVWKEKEKTSMVIASKGAPEFILSNCNLSQDRKSQIEKEVHHLGKQGVRVLAVGFSSARTQEELPEHQRFLRLTYAGLVGYADPLREDVPSAIQACSEAGIRVIMLTGDHPETAQAIAQQAGLRADDVIARMIPEHKLTLIRQFKERGDVVGMTGDGVNDAPALAHADVGIAMGRRGTDVAREAADIVLTDDNFSSIVASINLGRLIFDNIQKAIAYVLTIHIPIAGLAFMPVIMGWPTLLMPIHIVFLELVIDPACSIAFMQELGDLNIMRRSPRKPNAGLLTRKMILIILIYGAITLISLSSLYSYTLRTRPTTEEARTIGFVALILVNLVTIFSYRSFSDSWTQLFRRRNTAFNWIAGLTMLALCIAIYSPVLDHHFGFTRLKLDDFKLVFGFALAHVMALEFLKRILK